VRNVRCAQEIDKEGKQTQRGKEESSLGGFLFVMSLLFAVFLIASYSFACLSFFFEPSNFGSSSAFVSFPTAAFFAAFVPPAPTAASPAAFSSAWAVAPAAT
jgi:hypothetical protein